METELLDELDRLVQEAQAHLTQNPQTQLGGKSAEDLWVFQFTHAPEGVFSYEAEPNGDAPRPVPDEDTETGWTAEHNYVDFGRRITGEEYVVFRATDLDGGVISEVEFRHKDGQPVDGYWDADEWMRLYVDYAPISTLLAYRAYEIYCVRTGKDPLDFTYPEVKHARGQAQFTITCDNMVSCVLLDGPEETVEKVSQLFLGETYESLQQIAVEGQPENVPDDPPDADLPGVMNFSWILVENEPEALTFDVKASWCQWVTTPERIRTVMAKELETSVRELHTAVFTADNE